MSDLPINWHIAPIGDFTDKPEQRTPEHNENFYYVDIASIDRVNKRISQAQIITGNDAPSRARKVIKEGDVIVSMTRPNLNAVALVSNEYTEQIASTGFDVLRPKGVDSRWIFYIVRTQEFIEQMVSLVQGSLYPAIKSKDIRDYKAAFAPLEEQRHIADGLDNIFSKINNCRSRLESLKNSLKTFKNSVLDSAVSGKLTEDWRGEQDDINTWQTIKLRDVASEFSYGSSSKSQETGSIPVLRMGNIKEGKLDWNDLVYTSDPEEIKKYALHDGDVLFNRTNSPELVGKTAVYHGEQDAIYAGYLIKVKCSAELVPDYLCYCLNSPTGRDYCLQVKSDGVNQSNINAKKLADFSFNLPSVEEQHEIVRRTEDLLAYSNRIEASLSSALKQLEKLCTTMLSRVMNGSLKLSRHIDSISKPVTQDIHYTEYKRLETRIKPKPSKKGKMAKITIDSAKDFINSLPDDSFTFNELRSQLTADYETLKDITLKLLTEPNSIIEQVFDEDLRSMKFVKKKKA
jgi:type I restriction enzyme S subunit